MLPVQAVAFINIIRCLINIDHFAISLDMFRNDIYNNFIVKKKKEVRHFSKPEFIIFAKSQFERLLKKNLRVPVSIFHL